MRANRLFKKLTTLLFAIAIVFGTAAITTSAENPPSYSSGQIIDFAPLADGVALQTVPVGTELNSLNLPETLAASEFYEPDINVPVTWQSWPEYDGDIEGTYIFTPIIDGAFSAISPSIAVIVERASEAEAVFAELAPPSGLGLGLLLRGFNALTDEPDKKDVTDINNLNRGIFNNNAFESLYNYAVYQPDPVRNDFVIKARTIDEYANHWGAATGVSLKGELGKKDLFKLSLEQKWSKSSGSSISESIDTMFLQSLMWQREAIYEIDFYDIPEYLIQEQLTQRFKDDLLYASPEYVFNTYGTHFLTKYTLGGTIDAYIYSTEKTINQQFEKSEGADGIIVDINKFINTNGAAGYSHVSGTYTTGGTGGIVTGVIDPYQLATIKNTWSSSFNCSTNCRMVIVGNNPVEFKGIWELLPEGYEDRYYELAQKYITRMEGRDNDFFDNFIYKNRLTSGFTPINNVLQTSVSLEGVVGTSASQIPAHDRIIPADKTCGTNEKCIYSISTQTQLASIGGVASVDRYYILTNNIELSGNWTPIDNFRGTLDGNGYKITNLNVNDSQKLQFAGLFGHIQQGANVTIRNLGVHIGSSGINAAGTFSTTGRQVNAGGLIGRITNGTVLIEQCYVSGPGKVYANHSGASFVHSQAYAGGFIGRIAGGNVIIKNSYEDVDVGARAYAMGTHGYTGAGGFVGQYSGVALARPDDDDNRESTLYFENCYTVGKEIKAYVTGTSAWHEYAGDLSSNGATSIKNCYRPSSDQSIIAGDKVTNIATTRTPAQLRNLQNNRNLFPGWDIERVWENGDSNSYPSLRQFRTSPALILVYKNNLPNIYEGDVFATNIFSVYYTPHLYSSYYDVTDYVQLRYNFTHANTASPVQII